MNAVASQVAEPVPARVGPLRRALTHPAAIGLLIGLAVAIGLTGWFFHQAQSQARLERAGRALVLETAALADLVAAHQSAEDASDPALAAIADEWSRAGEDRYVRILRLSGARLLASTFPADAAGEMPRRLTRDEKWLFDLGQEIRAAIDTNKAEGVLRREPIRIEPTGGDRLRISMPYRGEGKVVGIVQLDAPLEAQAGSGWLTRALPAIVVPWIAFVALLVLVRKSAASQLKPWALWIVALAILAAATWIYMRSASAALESAYRADNERLAELYMATRTRVGMIAGRDGLDLMIAADANRWDIDRFERPLGLIDARGVNAEAVQAAFGTRAAALGKSTLGNLVVGALLLSFVAFGYARRLRTTLHAYRYAYLYVAPAMIGMLILVFFPFAYGIALSFTGQTLLNQSQPLADLWLGLANYVDILGDFDVATATATGWVINYQNFYWTLFVTICWTASNVAVGVTFGMILALVLNTPNLAGKAIYRVLLILPWAIPNYITALIWKGLFHPQFGAINQAIQMFGGEPVAWFDSVFAAFMTGLVTNGWLSFPFMMVVILGGLQSISNDMYEAATVEGASRWQQFWRITLPSLKPTLVPAIILSVVWTFNMFNVIYLVSGGAPAGANEILITKAYKIAFEEYRYAYSAAYSVVIFLILLVYGVFQTRVTRATEAAHA
jgi:arabinogalactan oligomer/maltooligosaccharide transport system permease protein